MMNYSGSIAPFNGCRLIEHKDHPVYRYKWMKKRHRKKRKPQRVRFFSHWDNVLEDGQVIENKQDGSMIMNPRTLAELMRATSNSQPLHTESK